MRARVQILDDRNLLVNDHELRIDGDYVFPIEGGIVDENNGYRLLGYELTGMWSKSKYEISDGKLNLRDEKNREKLKRREPEPLPASVTSADLPLAETLFLELFAKLPVLPTGKNDVARAIYNVSHSIDELVALLGDRLPKV